MYVIITKQFFIFLMQLTVSVFEKALSWTSTSLEKARILVEMYLAFVITESSEEKPFSLLIE